MTDVKPDRKKPEPRPQLSLPPLSTTAIEAIRLVAEQFGISQKDVLARLMERLEQHAITPHLYEVLGTLQEERSAKLMQAFGSMDGHQEGEVGGMSGLGRATFVGVMPGDGNEITLDDRAFARDANIRAGYAPDEGF